MKKILVPVRGAGKGDNVIAHAAALVRRLKAHLQVSDCRSHSKDLMPFGVPIPRALKTQLLDQISNIADQEEAGLRDGVIAFCKKFKLKITDKPTGKSATASFTEKAGRQVEATRAVGMSKSTLSQAKHIPILSTGSEPNVPTADELVDPLSDWGISAKVETFKPSRIVAKDLLALCQKAGADLWVMGAYGDSHERKTVFGGNTSVHCRPCRNAGHVGPLRSAPSDL